MNRYDPVSWVLEVEVDAGEWVPFHEVCNYAFPLDRGTRTESFYPGESEEAAKKSITSFLDFSDLIDRRFFEVIL